MRLRTVLIAFPVLLATLRIAPAQVSPTDPAAARAAVQRSLPFLQREGVAWMEQKGCASCHNVSFLLWSHNVARDRGIGVDETKLAEWTDWTWKFSRTKREWFKLTKASLGDDATGATEGAKGGLPADVRSRLDSLIDKPFSTDNEFVAQLRAALTSEQLDQHQAALVKRAKRPCEPTNDGGGLDTLSQLILGRVRGAGDPKTAAANGELRELMLRWQQPNGSWKAAGQLPSQNRPHAESDVVTTMWAVLALATFEPADASTSQAIRRALDFLRAFDPTAGESNEPLVAALLVERKFGQPKRADRLLDDLLKNQNADGGWAWRHGGDSDAFATGQALFALGRCDPPAVTAASTSATTTASSATTTAPAVADKNPIHRARRYLVQSQNAEGYWAVPSRAISSATNEGRLTRLAPIYRYWGTAWAVIGLTETLPPAKRQ